MKKDITKSCNNYGIEITNNPTNTHTETMRFSTESEYKDIEYIITTEALKAMRFKKYKILPEAHVKVAKQGKHFLIATCEIKYAE